MGRYADKARFELRWRAAVPALALTRRSFCRANSLRKQRELIALLHDLLTGTAALRDIFPEDKQRLLFLSFNRRGGTQLIKLT